MDALDVDLRDSTLLVPKPFSNVAEGCMYYGGDFGREVHGGKERPFNGMTSDGSLMKGCRKAGLRVCRWRCIRQEPW